MMTTDYQRVERAIRFIAEHAIEQPGLDAVAAHVALSPHHFQRLFRRWAGVSPKRLLQYVTLEHAKVLLREGTSVLDTSSVVGLSGAGRLHDLFVAAEGMTPGAYKSRGAGLTIRFGVQPSPFGSCLLAVTDRGLCGLDLADAMTQAEAAARLRVNWPGADLRDDVRGAAKLARQIFSSARGTGTATPLRLLLRGTNFQIKVWEALLRIPAGTVVSYGALAKHLGTPRATRAVANAVGRNPIAYLIPCHRVLRSTGAIGGYRSGVPRKIAMLTREWAGLARSPRRRS